MSFFDDLYQKLFHSESASKPLVHEVIKRSLQYKRDYLNWIGSDLMNYQMSQFQEGYWLKKNKIQGGFDVHLLNTSHANGFALSYNQELSAAEFQYFFDFLAEKIKLLPYKLSNSDIQIIEKDKSVETKEKHYLKPIIASGDSPIDQQFGNILIEHILINDAPSYIKLIASFYSDRLYKPAAPFDDLITHIFKA